MALGIARATLPQEFEDSISDKLLIAPEPQYLHALLIKGALEMSMSSMGDVVDGLNAVRGASGIGGVNYSMPDRGRLTLADPLLSDAVVIVDELSDKQIGHTVRINRPSFTDSTYTQASRRVPVGTTISTTGQSIKSEQVPVTLERFAGPYDNGASGVAPYALEKFDALRSKHNVGQAMVTHLQRDFDKWLDTVGVSMFDASSTITVVYPDGMTADNDSTVAGDFPMDYATLAKAETSLVNAKVPTFGNGKYIAILHQRQAEQLSRDPEYQRLAVYEPPLNPLYQGAYIKTVGNFMVFRSTTLTASSNSSSVSIKYGQAFGRQMVGVGCADVRAGMRGPQIVPSTADNYGETTLWIWLAYMGFSTLDDRFGVSIRTS